MFEAIREQGYAGSYGRVSSFVRRWRERQAEAPRKKADHLVFAGNKIERFESSDAGS
ncbi:hypothetical protein [Paraburkholderia youngii]|uniref:hypothetical protein n=1 Tax=Paraburkholderia youngii TaxID=2782701 RepID=UPI0020CC6282|nr:hypothetical protein [Paraburkholderia youngii]